METQNELICKGCNNPIVQLLSSCWCRCGHKVSPELWDEFIKTNPHPSQFGLKGYHCPLYSMKLPKIMHVKETVNDAGFTISRTKLTSIPQEITNQNSETKIINSIIINDDVSIDKYFDLNTNYHKGKIYFEKKLKEKENELFNFLDSLDFTDTFFPINNLSKFIFAFVSINDTHTLLYRELKLIDEENKNDNTFLHIIVIDSLEIDMRNYKIINHFIPDADILYAKIDHSGNILHV